MLGCKISLLWNKARTACQCGEMGMGWKTNATPTSRNSSPRFLWLEPIPSSQSCSQAPIFQCLSPTLLYRPWCLLSGWSTQGRLHGGKSGGGKRADWFKHNKCNADEIYAAARNIPAGKCEERASHRSQLAGLAGSSLDCCRGWAGITQSAMQRLQTLLISSHCEHRRLDSPSASPTAPYYTELKLHPH